MTSNKLNPYLITAALEIVAKNPDGFTISPDMTEQPQSGYACALQETQGSHGTLGFLKTLAYAIEHGLHFGGWLNEANGEYYFDAVRIFGEGQLNAAVKFGLEQNQIAIFDLGNMLEINLSTFEKRKV
jgi:hypothetical protein